MVFCLPASRWLACTSAIKAACMQGMTATTCPRLLLTCRCCLNHFLQAWAHIEGREGQALETLARIEAETAAERQHKQVGGAVAVFVSVSG